MVRMMIWNEKVSAIVVCRWPGHAEQPSLKLYAREHLHNGNMSLPPDAAATADICGQLVLTVDSGLRSAMTVPGQRSTTERATAAHIYIDDGFRSTQRPWRATAAGSDACSRRVQGTRPRPRTKSAYLAIRGTRHGRNTVLTSLHQHERGGRGAKPQST